MKVMRPVVLSVLLGVGIVTGVSGFAIAQPRPPVPGPGPGRVVVPPPPAAVHRAPVVLPPGWPLKRPPRHVVVRPPRPVGHHPVRVAPRLYLPPIIFGGVVIGVRGPGGYYVGGYSREGLVWQDGETLYRQDEWTEFTLDCNTRGSKLWFEVSRGRIQVDWAEVVFENGEVQVVEFPERMMAPGLYQLLDFRDGRRVSHVRMVAKTTSTEAKLKLWMER